MTLEYDPRSSALPEAQPGTDVQGSSPETRHLNFDKTSLEQAVQGQHIVIPTETDDHPFTPEQGFEHSPLTPAEEGLAAAHRADREAELRAAQQRAYEAPQPDTHTGRGRGVKIGAGALTAAVLLGVGVYGVSKAMGGESNEATPVATASVNPGEVVTTAPVGPITTAPAETVPSGSVTSIEVPKTVPVTPELTREQKIAAIEIPGGLSDKETAEAYADRFSQWISAGADQANYDKWYAESKATGITASDWAKKVAEQNVAIYGDALFGPNATNSGFTTKQAVEYFKNRNANTIWLFIITSTKSNSLDKEVYATSTTFNSNVTTEKTGPLTVMSVDVTEHDNGDKNRANELLQKAGYPNYNNKNTKYSLRLITIGQDGNPTSSGTSSTQRISELAIG